MKISFFIMLWVAFWFILGFIMHLKYQPPDSLGMTAANDKEWFCIIMLLVGGLALTVYAVMDLAIRWSIGG